VNRRRFLRTVAEVGAAAGFAQAAAAALRRTKPGPVVARREASVGAGAMLKKPVPESLSFPRPEAKSGAGAARIQAGLAGRP